MLVFGRAAKLARGAQLRARGVDDEDLLHEHLEGVGRPGESFLTTLGDPAAGPLGPLPPRFELSVAHDEDARGALLAYHAACCGPAGPGEPAGRDYAVERGWAAPQQALALQGRNKSDGPLCNLVVQATEGEGLVGVVALAFHWDACVVQAIHVAPRAKGPARLPEHLWERAKSELLSRPSPTQPGLSADSLNRGSRGERVAARAHKKAGSSSHGKPELRVTLEMARCQSRHGAAFWMGRCGWDGTADARRAAKEWREGNKGKSSVVGEYQMWCDL